MNHSLKFTRSLSDLNQIEFIPLTNSIPTNSQHSTSEPDLKSIIDDDEEDVWCNPEDEDNLKHCVEIDHERIEQLKILLGNQLFDQLLRLVEVRFSTTGVYFQFIYLFI